MAVTGAQLIAEARKHKGKLYIWGKHGPDSFDCSGFTYYVVNKVFGKKVLNSTGARHQLPQMQKAGKILYLPPKQWQAGDLVFIKDPSVNPSYAATHVGFALGNGSTGFIHASSSKKMVVEQAEYNYAKKYFVGLARITASAGGNVGVDPNTGSGGSDSSGGSSSSPSTGSFTQPPTSDTATQNITVSDNWQVLAGGLPLTSIDTYKGIMDSTLASITAGGTNRGYLVDLTNGGRFDFILPEFSEGNSANYDQISIPGRSSEVMSYTTTAGRKVSVNLELFAGEGLYTGSDPIRDLQQDVAFVKSLAYPNYQGSIVLPPPVVLCYLGPELIIKGVVTSVSTEYKKPYTVDGIPMRVNLSIDITQTSDNPADVFDMRNRNSRSY